MRKLNRLGTQVGSRVQILTLKLGSNEASGKISDSLNFNVLVCKLKILVTAF